MQVAINDLFHILPTLDPIPNVLGIEGDDGAMLAEVETPGLVDAESHTISNGAHGLFESDQKVGTSRTPTGPAWMLGISRIGTDEDVEIVGTHVPACFSFRGRG
jgi:hypothetical protein